MFNFKDLAGMNNTAQKASKIHESQENHQRETIRILKEISQSLQEIKAVLAGR